MPDSINEQHTFAPHDVAGMFGVSVMTVRRWAEYHKAHLSDLANPLSGKARAFTWADVEKLRQIKAWRDAGLSVEAINNRLSGSVTESITPTVIADSFNAIQAAQGTPDSTPAVLVALSAIDAMQRRLEALEQSSAVPVAKQGDSVVVFGVGFITALLFMLLLLALFALRNYL